MQVATVQTERSSVRSEIEAWTYEDSSLVVYRSLPNALSSALFIGYTPVPSSIPQYTCVLEMFADGWRLLGPPQREVFPRDDEKKLVRYEWWLTRKDM
jgi:hypothetical protein